MLDIRLIRENPDHVKQRLASRGGNVQLQIAQVDAVLAIDGERRQVETSLQELNGTRNRGSKEIGRLRGTGQDTSEKEAEVRGVGEEIARLTAAAEAASARQRDLLLRLPNLPHAGCPVGEDAAANPVVREWGEKPAMWQGATDHMEIGKRLGLWDLERAAKISGSGFVCFTGWGARLERALIQFMLDLHGREHGYLEVSPPYIVRREAMEGTSQLPKFEEDMYGIDGGAMFLAPTAEVPVTNLYREELLAESDLPKKLVAYTPCFRREAGSAGRETRGLIRVHQFDKIELVQIVHPDRSYEALEGLTANAEKVLQLLGLHYRVIELCTGDIGFGSARTYDIELWAPGQQAYLEVSSCSNFEDFQARRMNLRFRDSEKRNRFVHTLNGSGVALPRLMVAILETFQQPDGSVAVPGPLRDYIGAEAITVPAGS